MAARSIRASSTSERRLMTRFNNSFVQQLVGLVKDTDEFVYEHMRVVFGAPVVSARAVLHLQKILSQYSD